MEHRFSVNTGLNLWLVALAVYPILGVTAVNIAGSHFGPSARILAGILALTGFFFWLRRLDRWASRIDAQRRAEKREKYRGIYRIKAQPTSEWTWLKENIKIDDCAWERAPWRKDDLIYLHALDEQWGVVWMAGFRRADVEYVGAKPVSEYDWREFDYDGPKPTAPYQWGRAKAKTLCPFSVNTEVRKVYRWQYPV